VLGTGSRGYGRLLAGAGVGAILGALIAAGANTSRHAFVVNALMLGGMGVCLMALGMARTLPVAALCMLLVGSMSAVQLSTSNAFMQTSAPPELRGRVVSMYVWLFQGTNPMGGFTAGWLADRVGIPHTILLAGAACLAAGAALGVSLQVVRARVARG
jgi:predicted MFS family arabinose efflux permease